MSQQPLHLNIGQEWTDKKKRGAIPSPRKIGNPMRSFRAVSKKIEDHREKKKDIVLSSPHEEDPSTNEDQVEESVGSPVKEKRKRRKKARRKKAGGGRRLRSFTESSLEIRRVLEKAPEYDKESSTHLYVSSTSLLTLPTPRKLTKTTFS